MYSYSPPILYASLLFAYIAVGYEWHLDEIVRSEQEWDNAASTLQA
jgi:hypothetical protein